MTIKNNEDNDLEKPIEIKKNYGKTNKRKGSNAEREYAKVFREELGYTHCKTSRFGSKLHDNAGIDLICVPFNIQIKAGKQIALKAHKELEYIKTQTKILFPEEAIEQNLPKILIHRREVIKGQKRDEFSDIVSMTFNDFKTLIKNYKNGNN